MTPAQDELCSNLASLRAGVAATVELRTILDSDWFDNVERTILTGSPSHTISADPTGFLFDFCHPLRGVEWFERDQALVLAGRRDQLDEGGQLSIALVGLDPIKTMLPVIEERLVAFARLPFKTNIVRVKLDELKASRNAPAFRNHLFELNVLGDLAVRGVLVDIEDAATGVDGAIRLDGRDILVEATNTAQRVIPEFTGVFFGNPDVEIDQVVKKVRKKVADGRQLARANGKPTILFMARTHMGAGRHASDAALAECFRSADFASLSGVVLADSYRLHVTSWRPGNAADTPFTAKEAETLADWYAVK